MSEVRPSYDNEIDLFEFFKTLWDGKWIITAFFVLAILLGGGFLLFKDPVYESKLFFSQDTIPPFYNSKQIANHFQKKFYTKSLFENWKNKSGSTSIVFEDFSNTEIVEEFVLSRGEDEQLATLSFEKEAHYFMLVKSNQLPILNSFFEYAQYIDDILREEYVLQAKDELKTITSMLETSPSSKIKHIEAYLSINKYIVSAGKGASVHAIKYPTKPEKISIKPLLLLALMGVLGFMVGVFFINVSNAIKKHKEQLATVKMK